MNRSAYEVLNYRKSYFLMHGIPQTVIADMSCRKNYSDNKNVVKSLDSVRHLYLTVLLLNS